MNILYRDADVLLEMLWKGWTILYHHCSSIFLKDHTNCNIGNNCNITTDQDSEQKCLSYPPNMQKHATKSNRLFLTNASANIPIIHAQLNVTAYDTDMMLPIL